MDGTASGLKFTISLYLKLKSVQLGERPAVLVESGINMGVYVSIIIRSLCNIGTFLSPLISYFHFDMASQASATFLSIYEVLMFIPKH